MCRLSPVLLSGRLLLRGAGSPAPWQPVFCVLSERCLFWLSPPSPAWAAVSLENATIALAGGGGGGVGGAVGALLGAAPEAFEVSTARATLHFRCRGAAVAARWVALATGVAEQRTGQRAD